MGRAGQGRAGQNMTPEPQWIRDLEAFVALHQARLDALRAAVTTARSIFAEAPTAKDIIAASTAAPAARPTRRKAPTRRAATDEALLDRIIDTVRNAGATNMPALQAKVGGKPWHVKAAVRALVASKRLTQHGKGPHTTYEVRS